MAGLIDDGSLLYYDMRSDPPTDDMNGNENSPEDMGKYVASCGRIREAGGTHVMVVHHCGKDLAKGARGHSSLRADTAISP